jgi:hypothetical protein
MRDALRDGARNGNETGIGGLRPMRKPDNFYFSHSLPLIQATLVRGALVLVTPARPVLRCAPRLFLCLKRSKHKTNSFDAMLSRVIPWQNWIMPGRIQVMDPNLVSKVMQEMGRKGGKKGGKKGAKMRAEALTPEQRSQIARKAAKARWVKAKKKR